ncbi:hypothetical protein ACFW0P_00075 [Lysobacter soli]|uniref:hypothetical protein n=1 Tax=Lysobacter soli TaxID=453783 RepID=UPI003697A3E2
MSPNLRAVWWIFAGMCLLVLVGAIGWHVASRTVQARIVLMPGTRVKMNIFRFAPDAPRLSMAFNDSAAMRPQFPYWPTRPELGEWRAIDSEGSLHFINPGETVKLRVVTQHGAQVYEALPVSERSEGVKYRDLARFVDDGDAKRFHWPPLQSPRSIPAGRSTLDISVLEVESVLRGESVVLSVKPPLDFKRGTGSALDWLWFFVFWPVYVLVLCVAGAVLVYCTRRESSAQPSGVSQM